MTEPSTCAISASADACASRSTRTEAELRALMARAVHEVRETNPLAPSITNTVTQNFVANAQLAVGGSAAMVYLPDEGECVAALGGAVYINLGTLLPVYEQTVPPRRALARRRASLGCSTRWASASAACAPSSSRPCARTPGHPARQCLEIIAVAALGALPAIRPTTLPATAPRRGQHRFRTPPSALPWACARFHRGCGGRPGATDLVTDGAQVARFPAARPS